MRKNLKAYERGIISRDEMDATAKRDGIEIGILWLSILSGALGLACVSVTFPLLYCWLFGLLACIGIGAGTMAMLATMDGLSAAIWGSSIIRGGLEVIIVILRALVVASAGSN